ncbi:MAG TPA: hypothetical protein VL974_14655, partial [Magnetospirillum sp.]|nr:hypothetical protein [Magnetospirillum sp.]
QGTDEGSLREQLVAGLTAQGNSTTLSPLGRQALDSALAFLTSPRSLSLKAEPEQPMPLFQLAAQSGDPDTLANVMRLSVSANK